MAEVPQSVGEVTEENKQKAEDIKEQANSHFKSKFMYIFSKPGQIRAVSDMSKVTFLFDISRVIRDLESRVYHDLVIRDLDLPSQSLILIFMV